ncbi:cysteine proteinase [Biscogniauxia mediterranea]|nr:cysteine proteinase [Biscogniauxia mediterranea]
MDSLMSGMRRSGRTKKPPARYNGETTTPPSLPTTPRPATTQLRPKRKAAVAAAEEISYEAAIPRLEDFLSRVSPEERKEYRGWVELESEPAFFNAMLQELGAEDFKVQEVFGLDESTLDDLPKPVHGLIFLYQYTDADGSHGTRQDCPDNLWFGNQTTANACATVALMNILMNAQGVEFGPELQQFKEATKSLPSPHRGHALDTNDFIRVIHNSVARRTDLVSEDLLLDNKFEMAEKRRKMSLLKKKMAYRRVTRKKADRETSFHYIAYVPVDGQVWELDGFETKPLCLGPHADNAISWLTLAGRAIQTRMLRGGDDDSSSDYLSFNLLALCHSPLGALTRALSTSLRCSHALHTHFSATTTTTIPSPFQTFSPDRLSKLSPRLTRENILFFPPSPSSSSPSPSSSSSSSSSPSLPLRPRPLPPDFTITNTTITNTTTDNNNDDNNDNDNDNDITTTTTTALDPLRASDLARDLAAEQEVLEARIAVLLDEGGASRIVRGRRRDYTPAVHEWVRLLAARDGGLLRELLDEVGRES